jgi:hypothetical protein
MKSQSVRGSLERNTISKRHRLNQSVGNIELQRAPSITSSHKRRHTNDPKNIAKILNSNLDEVKNKLK